MSTAALPAQVALVDTTGHIPAQDLVEVAGAINEQIQSDFAPSWHANASVVAYPHPTVAPPNTWRVEVDATMDEPGALGYHADNNRQPYAKVLYTPDWSVTVSHEILEMLGDPFGNRLHAAAAPLNSDYQKFGLKNARARVHYLLEACDPCEEATYEVGGVKVSDFLIPNTYYRTNPRAGSPATHLGTCTPREVAEGGYVSFAVGDHWWQIFVHNGQQHVSDLGTFAAAQFFSSLREFTDFHARRFRSRLHR